MVVVPAPSPRRFQYGSSGRMSDSGSPLVISCAESQIHVAAQPFVARPHASDALGERLGCSVSVDGKMQEDQAAATREEGIQLRCLGRGPFGVVMEKRDNIRLLELLFGRPFVGGLGGDAGHPSKDFRPALAPDRIVVKARSIVPRILIGSAEDDVERALLFHVGHRRQGCEHRLDILLRARRGHLDALHHFRAGPRFGDVHGRGGWRRWNYGRLFCQRAEEGGDEGYSEGDAEGEFFHNFERGCGGHGTTGSAILFFPK